MLEAQIAEPNFWDKAEEDRNLVITELKSLKASLDPYAKCEKLVVDLKGLLEIVEADDAESIKELEVEMRRLDAELGKLEFRKLLGGEADGNNAILSINAGAGGTESCDWAAMILRMYKRWADDKSYSIEELDYLAGEEAGVKSVTFMIKGYLAYGYLKSENGVHRLVRISPFDSNKRRHTSFASVEVIPEIDDNIEIDINLGDLRIDTYRAGGAGGQHVNRTDSAVRITHFPSGIVVQCQNERSQHKNKASAMKMLKSRLYAMELEAQQKKLQQQYETKSKIEWGSQIRSYVIHPYNMVKDHRTDFADSDASGVLDGKLNGFMEAYLRKAAENQPTGGSA